MQIPAYADWRNRTVDAPSVILTPTQSRELLKLATLYARKQGILTDAFTLLRNWLQDDGWYRVEKHGDQLLLMGVLYNGVADQATIDHFIANGEKTGNWSWIDFQLRTRIHPANVVQMVR